MKVLKYLFASFLIISGMGCLFTGSILAGLSLFILGILLLPPVSEQLSKSIKLWKYRLTRYGVYIFLFFFAGATIKQLPVQEKSLKGPIKDEHEMIIKSKIKIVETKEEETKVDNSDFWQEFDPIVKERVYKLITEKDCDGLQKEFNVTADNMDRLQANGKSAMKNLDLMSFLEEKMKEINCN